MRVLQLLVELLLTAAALHADDYADRFRQAAAYSQQDNYEQAILQYKAARTEARTKFNRMATLLDEISLETRQKVILSLKSK